MKYLFIVNAEAGKGRADETAVPAIRRYFENHPELSWKIVHTSAPGDAGDLARQAAEQGKEVTIFACGGEGTAFEIVNGIYGFDNVCLGVVPCGSANDFLRAFGEKSRSAFLDLPNQMAGKECRMDLIRADEFYCLNGCSVGMDAIIARDMALFKRWPLVNGSLAYILSIVKTFCGKIGVDIGVSMDNGPFVRQNRLFAVITNGPAYGGGFLSAPKAVPWDGVLNFAQVKTISKRLIPGFLKKYHGGNHEDLPYCRVGTCTTMDFVSDKPVPVNLDGEIVERTKMHFELVPSALRFLVPASLADSVPACRTAKAKI